ncbi:MAG: LysM peptidoglycan-binding domain-containing protein [Gammaproteobacteria bacterium]|nr:LysM peptidoglycan-binding domain-containing protein [Gammaproteobacteria bacterium]MDP2140823.1 LysM peptidoglycan-binding domain-containing protein [Gammaproteobacteria bacterium]MDP2347569.1 LysM peptidoglycan-binding domain-containing protein [Gammaproteobacteria bacterium]
MPELRRKLKNQLVLIISVLLLFCVSAAATAQQSALFPRPPELEPAIGFWTRVYTEVDTESGFLHDAGNLAVIYQRIDYDRPEIERQRTRIQDALKVLGTGKRTGLTSLEQDILDKWPTNVSNATLTEAANNVRFQLGQSDRFVEGLIRSGAYRDHINSVVRDKDLPIELGALPHVESSFHPGAYSSVAAAGMWQFMRATGQRFMRIDHIVDERMDPYTATYAAMSLLEYNYRILGTWPLALTAYNHGTGGMSRAVRETGTNRIEEIIANYKGPAFGFASRNFYPQFLAVLDVERQAQTLFGVLQLDPHPEYEEFEMDSYMEAQTLADALGITLEHLKFDNPALRPVVWDGSKRIPQGYVVKVQKSQLRAPLRTLISQIPNDHRFPIQTPDLAYVVQSGDSLSAIARRFSTSVAQIASLNQLANAHRLQIGQRLLLPQDSAAASGQTSAQIAATATNQARGTAAAQSQSSTRPTSYTVRSGDTLSSITRRFNLEERAVLQANNIDHPDLIYPGQILTFPNSNTVTSQPVVYVTPEEPAPTPVVAAAPAPPAPVALSILEELVPPVEERVLTDADAGEVPIDGQEFAIALDPSQNVEANSAQAIADLAADPSDYSVAANNSIEIQASETLGHYADWLRVDTIDLRRLNRLSANQPVVFGNRLTLDFSNVSVAEFELKRREFHLREQQDFFRNYRIQDVAQHTVAANDNIARLARSRYSVPMWLLRQYNPELNFRQVQIGQKVVFPVLEAVAAPGGSS